MADSFYVACYRFRFLNMEKHLQPLPCNSEYIIGFEFLAKKRQKHPFAGLSYLDLHGNL